MGTDTIQVGPNPTATQIVWSGEGPVLIANNGPATIFVGDDNAIRATDSTGVIPVQVNGYFTVSGQNNLYACVAAGTSAQLALLAGGLNFFVPTNHLIVGTVPNTQIGLISSGGSGIIDFITNNPGYLDAQLSTFLIANFMKTIMSGPVKVGHTDAVATEWDSSDGANSAALIFRYFDLAAVTHFYLTMNAAGVNISAGNINGITPGTGTAATPAVPETAHQATLLNGWTASGTGFNGAFFWTDADTTVSPGIIGNLHILFDVNAPVGPPANSVMFVLPVEWRPQITQNVAGIGWNKPQVNNSTSLPWLNVDSGNGNVLVAGLEALPAGSIFAHCILPMGAI